MFKFTMLSDKLEYVNRIKSIRRKFREIERFSEMRVNESLILSKKVRVAMEKSMDRNALRLANKVKAEKVSRYRLWIGDMKISERYKLRSYLNKVFREYLSKVESDDVVTVRSDKWKVTFDIKRKPCWIDIEFMDKYTI